MPNTTISWDDFFMQEEKKPYFKQLMAMVDMQYANNICYPPKDLLFNAFRACDFNDIKVVIIGQDPYHGDGQANGLCFSVNDFVQIPPSLKNIFIEINNNFDRVFLPTSGNLNHWAKQGVLLLNATLSVQKNLPNSHKNLPWQTFTDAAIQYIDTNATKIVFMLWGSFAQKKGKNIDANKHFILQSGHPSPLSANRGLWFGNEHFKKANLFLESIGKLPINW